MLGLNCIRIPKGRDFGVPCVLADRQFLKPSAFVNTTGVWLNNIDILPDPEISS
jgi:hypothetical protein